MITGIIKQHTIKRQQESTERWLARKRAYGNPKLNASDVGHCPRKAFWSALRPWPEHPLHKPTTHPFSFYVEDVMFSGNVWEDVLAPMIDGGIHNYEVVTEHWGGEIDILLPQNEVRHIVELKDTAEHNFSRRNGLPYTFHCAQVLTYQRLLKEQESLDDDETDCWLYYHGRGHRAEFVVWRADGYMVYDGHIDGDGRSGEFEFDLDEELAALEQYWKAQKVPPSYPHPFFRSFGECISGSKSKGHFPSCQFWGHCWRAEEGWPQAGPFTEAECPL